MRKSVIAALIVLVCILIIGLPIYFTATPSGVSAWNNWFGTVQKADDDTNYETLKRVEDTCRSMISSYNSDKLIYEQYKDSDDEEKQNWAEQAKMRANKTANTYNNYILKNDYIWQNNIPADIYRELPYID
jgi:hypothetical protein